MGGRVWIASRYTYGFKVFIQVNKINGGEGRPLFNGLISKNDWEMMYRYYLVDLSRGEDEDDQTPPDIILYVRNDNIVVTDLYIFVLQTKKL